MESSRTNREIRWLLGRWSPTFPRRNLMSVPCRKDSRILATVRSCFGSSALVSWPGGYTSTVLRRPEHLYYPVVCCGACWWIQWGKGPPINRTGGIRCFWSSTCGANCVRLKPVLHLSREVTTIICTRRAHAGTKAFPTRPFAPSCHGLVAASRPNG